MNGIYMKAVDKFRVLVFAIQLIMLPKCSHFGCRGRLLSVYYRWELSACIVRNATQEMFKHCYLLQEVITPNNSRVYTFYLTTIVILKISESNLSLVLKTPKAVVSEVVNDIKSFLTIVNSLRLLFPVIFRALFNVQNCSAVEFHVN